MVILNGKKYISEREIHEAKYKRDSRYREGYDALETEFAVYDALIRLRIQKKITQKELARRIRTHQSSIARFESGKYNPSFGFVKKIVQALGLRIQITP